MYIFVLFFLVNLPCYFNYLIAVLISRGSVEWQHPTHGSTLLQLSGQLTRFKWNYVNDIIGLGLTLFKEVLRVRSCTKKLKLFKRFCNFHTINVKNFDGKLLEIFVVRVVKDLTPTPCPRCHHSQNFLFRYSVETKKKPKKKNLNTDILRYRGFSDFFENLMTSHEQS